MVHITDAQTEVRIPSSMARRLAARIAGKRNISVAFVTDAAMRKLNRRFLRHDYVTDVLSFPLGGDLFGEVVVAPGAAAAEARRRGIPVEEEILRVVAHGILHLLGYDDLRPAARARMWARQERELRKLLG